MSINGNPFTNIPINIKKNESLKNHTTFQIGGPAKYYAEVADEKSLQQLLKTAKDNNIPYLFIGGGSNLLVADKGFDGLIVKIIPHQLEFNGTNVKVDAGYLVAGLIISCLDKGLTGLEFMAGVPGTVGGAIKGNAGTYGEAMEKVVKTVNYLNEWLEFKTLDKSACDFTYRNSIFKQKENWLITSVVLQLEQGEVTASRKLINERLEYRQHTQPYQYPSAGCAFKNITLTDEIEQQLIKMNWEIPAKFKEYKKIPTSWIIEKLDLKGKTIGQAQVSEKHANYIVNLGGATADQVIQLISLIKQQVRDKTGIQLEEEVRYLGF